MCFDVVQIDECRPLGFLCELVEPAESQRVDLFRAPLLRGGWRRVELRPEGQVPLEPLVESFLGANEAIGEEAAGGIAAIPQRRGERRRRRQHGPEGHDAVLRLVVTGYTREAGVRQLERELGTLLRKTATAIASGDRRPPVVIDPATVRDALGRQKVHHEAAARTAMAPPAPGWLTSVVC